MFRVRLVRTARALAAVLLLAACSAGPESPDALFEEASRLARAGDFGAFWDLYSREGREEYVKAVEGTQRTIRAEIRNGNRDGIRRLSEADGITPEEFIAMTPRDIFVRRHKGLERVLEGATIADRVTDPVNGRDVLLTVRNPRGQVFRWTVRHEDGRGWCFHSSALVSAGDR